MAVRLGKQLAQDVWVGDSAVKQEASDFWQHTDQRVGDDRLHPHHTTVCCLNCAHWANRANLKSVTRMSIPTADLLPHFHKNTIDKVLSSGSHWD